MSRNNIPLLILACALPFIGARIAASAPQGDGHHDVPPGYDEDTIPQAQLPDQLKGHFETIRNSHQDLKDVVDKTQQKFNSEIVSLKTETALFSPRDVHFVGRVLGHVFDTAQEYQRVINDPNLTEDQRTKRLQQLSKENEDHRRADVQYVQKHQMGALAVSLVAPGGGSPMEAGSHHKGDFGGGLHELGQSVMGGVGGAGTPGPNGEGGGNSSPKNEFDQDRELLGGVVIHAIREAFTQTAKPGNSPSAPNLGTVIGDHSTSNDASGAMSNAADNVFKGNPAGALAEANRAVDLGGGAPAYSLRGGLELDQHQYEKAYQDAQSALKIDPANQNAIAIAHFSAGMTSGGGGSGTGERGFAGGGERAGGNATFGTAARLAAATPGVAASRLSAEQAMKSANNAMSLRDSGGALAYLNRGLEQYPNDPALLAMKAKVYNQIKDYKRASEAAALGLLSDPQNKSLLRAKAFADLRGGGKAGYEAALAGANLLIEMDPNDANAYALRAHAYGDMGDRDAMMADLKRAAEIDPRYQDAVAKGLAGGLQMPSDSDILFLFPGESAAQAATAAAAPASGRSRQFGILVGVSALGGLLLALGLLQTVLAPLKAQISSVFTRITRTGPSVAAFSDADTAQPASAAGHMPGLIRGQYEILRQIGQGGMGTVFEGTDRSLGRKVAIKKMRDELRVNPQERARFVIEAKTVAALHHPNIVDIYAIGEDGDDVYLIFEFVDGKTVHELVQRSGRLPIKDAARVTRAAADALSYAHSKGVVHRDMKPSNMMIDSAGRVKVMDFGIARMAKDAMTRYSMTNTVVGTPPYMAPEQEQGQVRRESDVYALAVCTYEMLTGKLPFIGTGGGMLLNKINMSYVPPSRETAGLPASLDEVFVKAFQADPERRFRTPQEFADAVESALPGVRV
jgi:tetratricopeptide (TPR) repeat protein/tRNA A-37 threonylcarbamoyl transferase component Bud32